MMSAPRNDGGESCEGQATGEIGGLLDDASLRKPIVRKIPLSKTRVMVCQFWEKRLLLAEITAARRRETTRPATTAATRQLPGARRESKTMKGIVREDRVR